MTTKTASIPTIRFRVLGGVDLRDAEGRELRSVLAQPKRLALLAWLALAAPTSYQRRDTLLALFWPEMDQERARRALRQAVHFLRRLLGAHVVVGRGEEIGLGEDALWCDAGAFDTALARGDPTEALALYHGDLLDGFFITDASSAFDEWLANERARYHQRAIEAAWSLSGMHEAAGHGAQAAEWARWAAARAPDDERTQRRMLALLDRLGDRTGALRAYEQLAERTREEFDVEPSAETRALMAAIRARETVGVAATDHAAAAARAAPAAASDRTSDALPALSLPQAPVVAPARPRSRVWMSAAVAAGVLIVSAYALRSVQAEHVSGRAPGADATAGANAATSSVPRMMVTTSSPVARKFYDAGLHALYDQGDPRIARSFFLDALQNDSLFAMAALYTARCDAALNAPNDGWAMLAGAMRLASRVTERERLIIETNWSTVTEDPGRLAIAESLVTRYPDEPVGHLALGTALTGIGDFLGAVQHLRRVITLDSFDSATAPAVCESCDAYEGMVIAYLSADSLAAAERSAREWVRSRPRSVASWQELRDVLGREGRMQEASDAERRSAELAPAMEDLDMAILAVHADDLSLADRLLASRVQYGSRDGIEAALWWLIIVRRNQGRMREAFAAARQYEQLRSPGAADELAGIAAAQVLFEQRHFLEAARQFDSLATLPPPTQPDAPGSVARHQSWLLTHAATAYAAAGDTEQLSRLADAVEGSARLSAYGRDWSLPHYLRGLLWKARGDPERTVVELRKAIWSPNEGYTRANFELAQASLAVNQPRTAVWALQAALRGPVEASNYYLTRTEVHELLARSFVSVGALDSAAAHFAIVARNWANGDPQFRLRAAKAAAARHRLERLLSSAPAHRS